MAANNATINVRLNSSIKQRGDEVLSSLNITPTQAVRALWLKLATERTLPDFILKESNQESILLAKRKSASLHNLKGCISSDRNLSDQYIDDLRFQSLVNDYESI